MLSHVVAACLCISPPAVQAKAEVPFVTMPISIEGNVGAFIEVAPLTNPSVKEIVFVPIDDGLNVFPASRLADKRGTVVTATKAGRYRLLAYTALGSVPSKPSVTTVVVGGAPPKPDPVDPSPVDPSGPVRPKGLAGQLFDIMKPLPKDEVAQLAKVLDSKLAAVAGVPTLKATIIADVLAGMKAAKDPSLPSSTWTPIVKACKEKMIAMYPEASDDETVWCVQAWKEAAEALSK